MEKDDFDWDDYIHTAGMGPRLLPVQATELLGGIGSRILRSLLVAAPDDIPEAYACSPEEAAVALACCELAELSVWDEAALIEAATVGGSEEQRLMWGCESRDRLARRISLSMKAEKAPEVMSPADGVLLLHRAGIHVFHQLLDVVAVMTIRQYTPESQSLYRQLKGIAEPQQTAPAADTAPPAPVEAVGALVAKSGPVLTAPAQCNSTKTPRSDSIDPVIKLAKTTCRDPNSTAEVWAQMEVLAQNEQAPFLASTEDGLKYHKKGADAYFTRDALDKRLHPEKRGTPANRRAPP